MAKPARQLSPPPNGRQRNARGIRLESNGRGWGFFGLLCVTLPIAGFATAIYLATESPAGPLNLIDDPRAFWVPCMITGGVLGLAALRKLLKPRVRLTLSSAAVPVGGAAQLAWALTGAGRLTSFELLLEGHEETIFEQGTATLTDRERFCSRSLIKLAERTRMQRGTVEVAMPADSMHSFATAHNRIVWTLRARGLARTRLRLDAEFPMGVAPSPLPS